MKQMIDSKDVNWKEASRRLQGIETDVKQIIDAQFPKIKDITAITKFEKFPLRIAIRIIPMGSPCDHEGLLDYQEAEINKRKQVIANVIGGILQKYNFLIPDYERATGCGESSVYIRHYLKPDRSKFLKNKLPQTQ